nr:DinB family protein [Metabacillus kandeliae]
MIQREIRYTYDEESWFVPLKQALEGVTAEQAHWRPEGASGNTIYETASHLLYYKERTVRLLKGNEPPKVLESNEASFTYYPGETEEEWQTIVSSLEEMSRELAAIVQTKTEKEYNELFAGKYTTGPAISDIALHDAYHAGQIVFLRKLQGEWPSQR